MATASMLSPVKNAKASDGKGFQRMFSPDRLTVGVFFPIETFQREEPSMLRQGYLAAAPRNWVSPPCGFAMCRCVPPGFGDIGVFDAWVDAR